MKFLGAIFLLLSFSDLVWAADGDDVKIVRMNGQNYKIWTDTNGVRRIDPVYLIKKSVITGSEKAEALAAKVKPKEEVVHPEKVKEEDVDPGDSLVVEMGYDACRESLGAAEGMASLYNVIFDYPKGQKLTVLMVVDNKTVQLKCEYGTRVVTTWEN